MKRIVIEHTFAMPIDILRLLAFKGPNIRSPHPSVQCWARSSVDHTVALRNTIKDAAQQIGIVIAALHVVAQANNGFYSFDIFFVTSYPSLGAALVHYAVQGLNALISNDESWDSDEQLWQLQQRRRGEVLPLKAAQRVAEASKRGIPTFRRADNRLQLGYGARGMALDITALPPDDPLGATSPDDIPWQQLGDIPIIAISGGASTEIAIVIVAILRGHGYNVGLATAASYETAHALLENPTLNCAVLDLAAESLFATGLAFESCVATALVGLPATPVGASGDEIARAVGLPLLATSTHGLALINPDEPQLRALEQYAPCPVVFTNNHDTIVQSLAAAAHAHMSADV